MTTTTPRSFGLGIAFILSASGKILEGLIGIAFTAEADGVLILTPTPVTAQVTFDIQVDVSVCWFLDVTFEAQTQWTETL